MAIDDLPKRGLGRVLQESRARLGLSRRDLATLALLSYPYLAELENGAKYPSHDALVRIAAALEMSAEELEAAAGEAEGDLAAHSEAVNAAARPSATPVAPDLVDQLTREVLAEIEPAVRRAIRAAFRSEQ
jgi:transcriptional regulator with XRE-family HTH domain